MKKRISYLHVALVCTSLIMSSGCDFFKTTTKEKSGEGMQAPVAESAVSATLISIDGKPVVSVEEFDQNIQMIMQQQPQFAQILPMVGPQIFTQMAEGMALERLTVDEAKRRGLDKTEDFKKQRKQVLEAVERELLRAAFQQDLLKQITVTDDEAKEYYNTNADSQQMKNFMLPAGYKAEAVIFANEKEAQDFAAKARKGDFAQLAQAEKKAVESLGIVNDKSQLDKAVKAKIIATKLMPAVEVVKGSDNKVYVVKVLAKQEEALVPFEQVKDYIKEMVRAEKFKLANQQAIEDLKKSHAITVDENALDAYVQRLTGKQAAAEPEAENA